MPGKTLEMIVDSDRVYILEADGELLPLDESAATPPAISRTWFAAGMTGLYRRIRGDRGGETESGESSDLDGTDSGAESLVKKGGQANAGGKRRKPVKRR